MWSRLVIPAIIAAALAAACLDGSHAGATSTSRAPEVRFTFGGFSLEVPTRWHTGVRRNDDGSTYVTAASSDVDEHEAALGIGSQASMRPDDVLVSIAEIKNPPDPSGFQKLNGAPHVSRDQLGDYAVPAPAMSIEAYKERGRYFQIGIAFGRARPTDAQLRTANVVVSSLTVRSA